MTETYFFSFLHPASSPAGRHYLERHDALLAESFYGLKRVRLKPGFEHFAEPLQTDKILSLDELTRRRSLFFLTLLPYIKSKLDRAYDKWAGPLTPFGRTPPIETDDNHDGWPLRWKLARWLRKFFVAVYPAFHVFWEGTRLISQWQFAVGEKQFYSPLLWWLGVALLRIEEKDHKDYQQRAEDIKERTLGWIKQSSDSRVLQLLQRIFFKTKWALLEYANFGLMFFAVAFKVCSMLQGFSLPFFLSLPRSARFPSLYCTTTVPSFLPYHLSSSKHICVPGPGMVVLQRSPAIS